MSAAFGLIVIFLLNCDGSCISGGGLLQIRETERDLGIERRPRRGPVTPALLKSLECDMLPLAPWNLPQGVRTDASNVAMQIGVDIALLHGSGVYEDNWTELINVDGLSLTTVRARSTSWLSVCSKRVTDVVVSPLLLVLLAPLILIAILIRLDSPAPRSLSSEGRAQWEAVPYGQIPLNVCRCARICLVADFVERSADCTDWASPAADEPR